MIHLAVTLALLATVAYFAVTMALAYRSASGTTWARLIAAAKGSATILWARFVAAITMLATAGVELATTLDAPSVAQAIQSFVQPQYVSAALVAVAVISELARKRTLALTPPAEPPQPPQA